MKTANIGLKPKAIAGATGLLEKNLADSHVLYIKTRDFVLQLREDIEACEEKHPDAGTADFLTQLLQKHEKMAWMLPRFLLRHGA